MARDLDHIGIGLGNTSGDGADADLSHQLDAHASRWVHLVQVMNQLRQILNRIDVVVRRRRDQSHTRLAVAQPSDVWVHLGAGQLTAFTWLGALSHFDLKLLAAAQVFRGHTETT